MFLTIKNGNQSPITTFWHYHFFSNFFCNWNSITIWTKVDLDGLGCPRGPQLGPSLIIIHVANIFQFQKPIKTSILIVNDFLIKKTYIVAIRLWLGWICYSSLWTPQSMWRPNFCFEKGILFWRKKMLVGWRPNYQLPHLDGQKIKF